MKYYDIALVEERVSQLIIQKCEGAYWDFKQEWHLNLSRLLHDILCMANNLLDEDSYIIIGVQDDGTICGINDDDSNRKTQAKLINWLSQIEFAGDRPDVQVYQDIDCDSKKIDVIVISQKNNGPYYLKERYQEVSPNNIYTRVGDTNTPINESATFFQVETLWRKRFGILNSVQEKAVKYIYDLSNWEFIDSNGTEDAVWYYKGDPAYTITTKENSDVESTKAIDSRYYYLCVFINIAYHPGMGFEDVTLRYNTLRLFEGSISMIDECRTKVIDGFGYLIKGTLHHGIYEFVFANMCGNYSDEAKEQIERVVPIYKNIEEQHQFEEYANSKGWSRFNSVNSIYDGGYRDRVESCKVETPKVVNRVSEDRNIEQLLEQQKAGSLFNFYNERDFSADEQTAITRKLKEGYVFVEMLKEWREDAQLQKNELEPIIN